jgi:hypothetical protein
MRPFAQRLALRCAVASAAALAGCAEETGPLDPTTPNAVSTVSLWAVSGTPVYHPSAYDIKAQQVVRISQTLVLDFAFDIEPGGEAQLVPTDVLGLTGRAGLQRTTAAFEAVVVAPTAGYLDSSAVTVTVGDVVLVRSRPDNCFIGTVPYYAKLRVLAVNDLDRRLDMEILSNVNCGWRGLEPGLPTR